MTNFTDKLKETVLLHTADENSVGRAMIVNVRTTTPCQLDLYCGEGTDDEAIVCLYLSNDGHLEVELTDGSGPIDTVVFHRRNGKWVMRDND